MIERQLVGGLLVEQLDAQVPLGKVARLDRIPQIATMEIRIGAVDLDRLVPQYRLQALARFPVELNKGRPAVRVDQPEAVHAEPFHGAERARDRAVGHLPHDHVPRLRAERGEVPIIVVSGLRLREGAIRLLLHGVDEIGEFDRILDEEHRNVVADDVPIALLSVKFDGEAAHIARHVHRPLVARHGGEADKHFRFLIHGAEHIGLGVLGQAVGQLEHAVRAIAARVDDAFGDTLVIEVENLFAQDEVFQQRRAARAGA